LLLYFGCESDIFPSELRLLKETNFISISPYPLGTNIYYQAVSVQTSTVSIGALNETNMIILPNRIYTLKFSYCATFEGVYIYTNFTIGKKTEILIMLLYYS